MPTHNVTPRRALRLAHFTRGLCLLIEDGHPTGAYWTLLAEQAEIWAKAKLAGERTNLWVQQTNSFTVTDQSARILSQTMNRHFHFTA